MRIFSLNNTFSFGPYRGLTLSQVLEKDPTFVDELLIHDENFIIDPFDWQYIIKRYKFSRQAVMAQQNKYNFVQCLNMREEGEDFYGSEGFIKFKTHICQKATIEYAIYDIQKANLNNSRSLASTKEKNRV